MFIPRVYYPHSMSVGETLTLDKETSHYLLNVLRLKSAQTVRLFNGQGGEYSTEMTFEKKTALAKVLDFNATNRSPQLRIHLGQGIARGDRMDYVIQKATELGVYEITPLNTEKSQVKLDDERKEKRGSHWQRIAISACEQCGMNELPIIQPLTPLLQWAKQPFAGLSIIFEPDSEKSLKKLMPSGAVRIAIGPESGWSEKELQALLDCGFQAIHLGPRILRAETAGMVGISIIQGLYGDLG